MDEPIKVIFRVVLVVVIAVALIAFANSTGFLDPIKAKMTGAIDAITWGE